MNGSRRRRAVPREAVAVPVAAAMLMEQHQTNQVDRQTQAANNSEQYTHTTYWYNTAHSICWVFFSPLSVLY